MPKDSIRCHRGTFITSQNTLRHRQSSKRRRRSNNLHKSSKNFKKKDAIKLFIQHLIDSSYKSRPSVAIDIDNMLLQRFNTLIWGFGGIRLDFLFNPIWKWMNLGFLWISRFSILFRAEVGCF